MTFSLSCLLVFHVQEMKKFSGVRVEGMTLVFMLGSQVILFKCHASVAEC